MSVKTLESWINRKAHIMNPEIPDPVPAEQPAEPKINPWTSAQDSEWLVEWCLVALQAGRIQMGAELAKLAAAAERYERGIGQHRPEATPAADEPKEADLPAPIVPGLGQSDYAPSLGIATPVAPVIASARCRSTKDQPPGAECHGVAYYNSTLRAYTHMDSALDRHHYPVVPELATAHIEG